MLNPFLILLSLFLDLITLPSILLKDEKKFNYKYQQTVDVMTQDQITFFSTQVLGFLYQNYHHRYKGRMHSLK